MPVLKQFFRLLVQKFLEFLVRIKLARLHPRPQIIGITGSFGKTTTKEAIAHVLKTKWRVQSSQKSLNTEMGLLLAALQQPSGFSSPFRWLKILAAAVWNAFAGPACNFLILEYGADKPGDIQHLVKIVRPDISIITRISCVHAAPGQFEDEKAVFEEKRALADCLPHEGIAILNREDEWLQKLNGKIAAKIFWYAGTLRQALHHIGADQLKNTKEGFSATIHMGNHKIEAKFPVAGSFHINAFLPALLIGTLNGITLAEGIKTLENFRLPPGRMSIIPGKYGSTILDSTYNASPEAVTQALNLLKEFPGSRKIAVLGNMNELGEFTREAHRKVANNINSWLDKLITVGEFAMLIADKCLKNGFPKHKIKTLTSAEAAAQFLLQEYGIKKGDIILLKGSQNRVRLERAVKLLMAHPEDAKKLLCRQEDEWKKIE